eukprot:328900_1
MTEVNVAYSSVLNQNQTDNEEEKYAEHGLQDELKYIFSALKHKHINQRQSEIEQYFKINNELNLNTMKARDFRNNITEYMNCEDNDTLIKEIDDLYQTMKQYPDYKSLKDALKKKNHEKDDKCNYCCRSTTEHRITIINRQVLSNKIILYENNNDIAPVHTMIEDININHEKHPQKSNDTHPAKIELTVNNNTTVNPPQQSPFQNELEAIEISSSAYDITNKSLHLAKGDVLSTIGFDQDVYNLNVLHADEVYSLLKYQPMPFTLTFNRDSNKCNKLISYCKRNKSNNELKQTGKCEKCMAFLKHPKEKILSWLVKFVKLTLGILTKASAILDAVTDLILLYKASNNSAIIFTMILFVTLLSPYILSYSSGVQIFLYRKTFENVELFTFKSLALCFYLFPSGILYFIALDIVDVLMEVYKWFAFGCINKIKTQQELVQFESNIAEYFGMSRMDWCSFKKQKLIAQLFFETVPQVILQGLLFGSVIKGRELTGITDRDLILSIGSAVFNLIVQLFRLFLEKDAVKESFVQYAFNCMTARFAWVPYKHILERMEKGNINYNIQYNLPLITFITKYMKNKNDNKSLQVGYKHKKNDVTYGSVEYDFSANTVKSLISTIKGLQYGNNINIEFGKSLRLLDVRSIISLMQACHDKGIQLPDIHKINWRQAFMNSTYYEHKDISLFSHTFDESNKSLLISMYLTGYHA